MPTKLTSEIITAAIQGFAEQKRHIDWQIAELRAILSGGPSEPAPDGASPKRKISAAARRGIALARRARWARLQGESERAAPALREASKPKRNLGAASRKRIAEAARKRWAAVRAQNAATKEPAARKSAVKKAKQIKKRR
jgi:hypothetical protein